MAPSILKRALLLATTLYSFATALECNYYSAAPANCDPSVCNTGGGHGLYLFGDLNGDSQFIFTSEEGIVTAGASLLSLQGSLVPRDLSHTQYSYQVELMFERTHGMGMIQLMDPSVVNATSWEYYRLVSGFMRSNKGQVYQIQQQMEDMPMQIGYGANSKNLGFGASIWINVVLGNTHIAGDFDLDLNCTAPHSSSSEDCPIAPFFSVNDDNIYACYTATPDSLDANILFADGFTYNWHPSAVFATADNCYVIRLPSGHGRIVWVQVHGFNCHYGENNIGREQNCGVSLCPPPHGSSSSASSESSSVASSSESSMSSMESSSSSVPASSSSQESSSSSPASSSQEASSSAPASSSNESSSAPSSSSQESSAASSSSQDLSSSGSSSTCDDTCPSAPFFSVNSTQVYACFTTLPDSDMDANIRYEDGTIFNWHPYDYTLDSNKCITFFVPNDNEHGAIVWAQVNGFNCHYGENNSGREQNCGWNLCQACGSTAPITSGLPSGVPPYTPVNNGNNINNGGQDGTNNSPADSSAASTACVGVTAVALIAAIALL